MASTFTLDDIRAAAEKAYGTTEIVDGDVVVARLLNPLRLTASKRAALKAAQEGIRATEDSGDADQDIIVDHLRDAIRAISETDAQATALLRMAGDDAAILISIFNIYSKSEASPEA